MGCGQRPQAFEIGTWFGSSFELIVDGTGEAGRAYETRLVTLCCNCLLSIVQTMSQSPTPVARAHGPWLMVYGLWPVWPIWPMCMAHGVWPRACIANVWPAACMACSLYGLQPVWPAACMAYAHSTEPYGLYGLYGLHGLHGLYGLCP